MTTPTSDFYLKLTKQCQHLRVPQPRFQWLQSNFTQRQRITRGRVVGGFGLIYLHTWVNMPGPTDDELKEFRHQGRFYARIFSGIRPARYNDQTKYPDERWVRLHVAQGHYGTGKDFMKGIRQALRDEFGQSLWDQEFKFAFDEDAKRLPEMLHLQGP